MTAGGARTVDLVVFHSGSTRFAVEARHVAGMRTAPEPCPDDALTLAPLGRARIRLLDLVGGRVLAAEEPVTTLKVAAIDIQPLPMAMAARMERPEIRALLWDDGGLIAVADPFYGRHRK